MNEAVGKRFKEYPKSLLICVFSTYKQLVAIPKS